MFTNELGEHLAIHTVYKEFKKIAASIGCPEARFHDLRHPYVKHKTKKYLDVYRKMSLVQKTEAA